MRYYIISGEKSGDMHAANMVAELREKDKDIKIRAWGGKKLKEQGAYIVKDIKELAFMGFWEVFINLPSILRNISFCKKDILKFNPDVLILVDYPGFNFRIADFAKSNNIKIHYYISPQIWAWNESRIKKIKKNVDKMFVILPFEKEFYRQHDFNVDFVGHPLIDEINKNNYNLFIESNKDIIALLPGSRRQEISQILPTMLSIVDNFNQFQFIIAATDNIEQEFYRKIVGKKNVIIVNDQTYGVLSIAKAALVTSGTATLEAALFKVPQVVCYKTNFLSYIISRLLVRTRFISLVNIVMDSLVVTELIQNNLNHKSLTQSLSNILDDINRNNMINKYNQLEDKLGNKGASKRLANLIYEDISS
tara:strand:+ start:2393 stop:3484 length:1092 start_codon:yes stop_codon:yes gene_type:complete